MYLKNHVADRLLHDPSFWLELLSIERPSAWAMQQLRSLLLYRKELELTGATDRDLMLLKFCSEHGKIYLVTNTVVDKLHLLKCRYTKEGDLDWSVFKELGKTFTSTFVLPNNEALRIRADEEYILMLLCTFENISEKHNSAELITTWNYIERETYAPSDHLRNEFKKERAEYIYKLLAFIYLSETTEELMKPGEKRGTKKTGKIINTFDKDITIINSKWNVTYKNEEETQVSGYFAIRWTGKGRTLPQVVPVTPYVKKPYVKKAGSLSVKEETKIDA